MRLRERPSRDLPTALREYSPGNSIVLDGLSYTSAGILLNKFRPDEDFASPQRMLVEWRCHSCGAIGQDTGTGFDELCSECGSELKDENQIEFVTPEDFVDFYSSPTNDVTTQSFVPIQEPWVSAGVDDSPLFNPILGSYRCSPNGHIFHRSSGEHGAGYALCLRCGRADSMSAEGGFPAALAQGKSHTKLQGKPGPESSAHCEGSDEPYAIKGGGLGCTSQTDVYELNLKHPSDGSYLEHDVKDPLAWTLAVVLRQALADIHGISADELGYMVKPTAIDASPYPIATIVLYDKHAGGAGFASSAPRFLQDMLKKARHYLDCPDGCESACQACLLGFDTRFHSELMHRGRAAEYLDCVLPHVSLPEESLVFGASTRPAFNPSALSLFERLSHGATSIKIFTTGRYGDWQIDAAGLKETCLNMKFISAFSLCFHAKIWRSSVRCTMKTWRFHIWVFHCMLERAISLPDLAPVFWRKYLERTLRSHLHMLQKI